MTLEGTQTKRWAIEGFPYTFVEERHARAFALPGQRVYLVVRINSEEPTLRPEAEWDDFGEPERSPT